mmetsp:Transcript_16502/g.46049  ORF Transcript_16502/g.46049 Transcript_16502/m.46049 type:complete len:207 (+) Transcript_16502:2912-3532(+)
MPGCGPTTGLTCCCPPLESAAGVCWLPAAAPWSLPRPFGPTWSGSPRTMPPPTTPPGCRWSSSSCALPGWWPAHHWQPLRRSHPAPRCQRRPAVSRTRRNGLRRTAASTPPASRRPLRACTPPPSPACQKTRSLWRRCSSTSANCRPSTVMRPGRSQPTGCWKPWKPSQPTAPSLWHSAPSAGDGPLQAWARRPTRPSAWCWSGLS